MPRPAATSSSCSATNIKFKPPSALLPVASAPASALALAVAQAQACRRPHGQRISLGLGRAFLGLGVLIGSGSGVLAHPVESNDPVTVVDSLKREVHLPQPAHRVISLAPHATELIAAAGGLDTLVGVIRDSDFPPMVKLIPQVGSAAQVDVERLLTLTPDLVVGWQESLLQTAERLLHDSNTAVYYSAPRTLEEIPQQIETLGMLLGTPSPARRAASQWREKLARLQAQANQHPEALKVFIEVGRNPLYTLNHQHILTQVIETCGGENVFAQAPTVAPVVGVEAVLTAVPDLLIVAEPPTPSNRRAAQEFWQRYAQALPAASQPMLIDPDLLVRPGPRMLEGLEQICDAIELRRRQLAQE